MRRLILVFAALAAASCQKHDEGGGGNSAAAVSGATVEFPELTSDLYCARFAAGAGKPEIEESCKKAEATARTEVMAMNAPSIVLANCSAAAKGAGGSYQVLKLCIDTQKDTKL